MDFLNIVLFHAREIVRRFFIRVLSVLFLPFFAVFFVLSTTISFLHGIEYREFYDFSTGLKFFKFLVWNLMILGGRE